MLSLSPLTDKTQLERLYADPYILRAGHDYREASPVYHPAASYVGAYVDGSFVGAFLIIEYGEIELEIHALLKREAVLHSRELGRMVISRIFSDVAIKRITAYIIQGLETVRNYCLKLGFQYEGMRRDAVMIRGQLLGVHVMGITRKDWGSNGIY